MEDENKFVDADTQNGEDVTEQEEAFEEEDIDAIKESNKRLFARVKKAESELKAIKGEKYKTANAPKREDAGIPDVEKLLNERMEARDLEDLEVSDEIKAKIKSYAKAEGLTVKKAAKSEYVAFLVEKEERAKKAEEASLGAKTKGTAKKDYSQMKASDFDLKTKEGREDFAKYEEHLRKMLG